MAVVASTFNVSGNHYIGTVVLHATALAVLVSVVVLQVAVDADGSTSSAWGFLLGVRSSFRELSFHLGFLKGSWSSVTGF